MISKEQAIEILKADLIRRGEKYNSICTVEEVNLAENWKLAGPENQGKTADVYLVWYAIPWAIEDEIITADISLETGEIFSRIGSPSYTG